MVHVNVITISKRLQFQMLSHHDYHKVLDLMKSIYLPVYSHLWEDRGDAYLQRTFCLKNVEKEANEEDCMYGLLSMVHERIGILKVNWSLNHDSVYANRCRLHRVYFSPKCIGQGLGNEVLNWVDKEAVIRGKKYIQLEAMDTSLKVLKFYEKHGYQKVERIILDEPLVIPEYKGMWKMIKSLE